MTLSFLLFGEACGRREGRGMLPSGRKGLGEQVAWSQRPQACLAVPSILSVPSSLPPLFPVWAAPDLSPAPPCLSINVPTAGHRPTSSPARTVAAT